MPKKPRKFIVIVDVDRDNASYYYLVEETAYKEALNEAALNDASDPFEAIREGRQSVDSWQACYQEANSQDGEIVDVIGCIAY